jgi:arginyl-tRNA synthetase
MGKSPREVADSIVAEFHKLADPEIIGTVTVAGPGFINISLTKKAFHNLYKSVVYAPVFHEGKKVNTFGLNDKYQGKTILVEHSSPNLFKPFHIGHMMNNAIGESLVRLMKFSGARVTTMSFPSDISLGIAKAVAVAVELYPNKEKWEEFMMVPDFMQDVFLSMGHWYVAGTQKYIEDINFQEKAKKIADILYRGTDSFELTIYNDCKKINISYFEDITRHLGSHFDSYIYESEAGIVGKDLVVKNTPTIFTKSEGAIVFVPDESKKGLNTAVFINSQGNPTYEAKDIGLLDLKFERVHPDL